MNENLSHPLKKLVQTWLEKIRLARKDKKERFQNDADEAMQFFDSSGDWLKLNVARREMREDVPRDSEMLMSPSFQMRVNKVAEMRDLFGPALYHTNPDIRVEPHDQVMVPPEVLGIDPQAMQQMSMDPMLLQDPGAQQQFMQLQQQMMQYEQLARQQQVDQTINETRGELIRRSLNYMQFETDKKTHSRHAIDEALIMGAGVLWHELDTSREGTKLVGSYYDSIKRLFIDPDARIWSDIKWIARECIHPYWQIEDEYNLPRGTLKTKGMAESSEQESELNNDEDATKKKAVGKTNDLVRYFKVYSKMGMGGRLKKIDKTNQDGATPDPLLDQLEEFGDYCFLVLVDGIPYPINLPQDAVAEQPAEDGTEAFNFPREVVTQPVVDEMGQPSIDPMTQEPATQPVMDEETGQPQTQMRADVFLSFQWPIPYWADDSWPFEMIWYRWRPDEVWPMPIVKSGMGELRFINWVMSHLAVKTRRACQTTVAVVKAAGEEIKNQLLSGNDFNILELESALGTKLDEIVSFLQVPEFHADIWRMLTEVFDLFDKRVGLTELIYGVTSNQLRTAAEANVKQENLSIRPDDMRNMTEDFMSKVARKEAMAMRWLLEGKDVQPYLGPVGAMVWDQFVTASDMDTVTKEFRYRIEAGSMAKPNRGTEIANANQSLQAGLPAAQWYAGVSGDVAPMNALFQKWSKANETPFPLFQPIMLQPQQPGMEPQQGPPKENSNSGNSRTPA